MTWMAGGKSLLAHLPVNRRKNIIDRHGIPDITENTITNRVTFTESLEDLRRRGYAFGRGEQLRGLRAIGGPVTGPDDCVLGAMSIAGSKEVRRDDAFEDDLPEEVISTVNVIELRLIVQLLEG